MSHKNSEALTVFAPAKINLYLHITGRLDNGHHTLDSLVAFADIGDQILIESAPEFSFAIRGPYANSFVAKEQDASPDSANLAVQAVWAYARVTQREPQCRVTLTKNLPLASGLGGGSANAAAVIWGLAKLWNYSQQASYMPDLLSSLGADVPACMSCQAQRMQGTGDILQPAPAMEDLSVILIHPGRMCSTKDVFMTYTGSFEEPLELPEALNDFSDLVDFLSEQNNNLTQTAVKIVPEIALVLEALHEQSGCKLARMSGSGATCFGLFANEHTAHMAAENILKDNPKWWVRAGTLNRPERY